MTKQKINFSLKKTICILILGISMFSYAFIDDLFIISKNLDIFASIYKEINLSYVDEVNSSKLMQTGIDAVLNELDPYTQYVPESEMEDFRLAFVSSEYNGIGAKVSSRNGKILISEVFESFPAQKADVRVGDEILGINDIALKGKAPEQVSLMLKGLPNTTLKLLINRIGFSRPIEKKITRTEIRNKNIPYYGVVANQIGYIKLDKFQLNSGQEVASALTDLQKSNLEGLILDLRNNGGGMVIEAIKILNFFLQKDVKVAIQQGRQPNQKIIYQTTADPIASNLPLVVLMNNYSASASEIVAGALQDLDRAVIIGQRSFGKGLVQQTINMPYNSLLKITIAKYYTPSGRCIQALDYAHRKADGNVSKIADSLVKEYKTKGGRLVYDGNGIYPDELIPSVDYHSITKVLIDKNHIFDYATKFRSENMEIGEGRNFKLTDAAYEKFLDYLSSKDYNYDTPLEASLKELSEEAKKESKFAAIKTEYENLRSKIQYSKKNDLNHFRGEIKQILENEIVSRYYFERGQFEHSFQYDKEIKEAVKVLTDKTILSSILAGFGTYKTIGRPK